jgi:hypothetical protein
MTESATDGRLQSLCGAVIPVFQVTNLFQQALSTGLIPANPTSGELGAIRYHSENWNICR